MGDHEGVPLSDAAITETFESFDDSVDNCGVGFDEERTSLSGLAGISRPRKEVSNPNRLITITTPEPVFGLPELPDLIASDGAGNMLKSAFDRARRASEDIQQNYAKERAITAGILAAAAGGTWGLSKLFKKWRAR